MKTKHTSTPSSRGEKNSAKPWSLKRRVALQLNKKGLAGKYSK